MSEREYEALQSALASTRTEGFSSHRTNREGHTSDQRRSLHPRACQGNCRPDNQGNMMG